MPVVRAGPTHPQLFLSSSLTLFHFLALFLSLYHIQLPFRDIDYLEMQLKLEIQNSWIHFALSPNFHLITLHQTFKYKSYSTPPFVLFLFYNLL